MRVRCNLKIYADVSIEKDLELEIFNSTGNSYKIIAMINLKLQRVSTSISNATIWTENTGQIWNTLITCADPF